MRTVLALALALLAAPAAAQGTGAQGIGAQGISGVPEALRGPWFAGDCADPQAMLVLTGRGASQALELERAGLSGVRVAADLAAALAELTAHNSIGFSSTASSSPTAT